MRQVKLLTQCMILLMVMVIVTPDLFHHVPMPAPLTAGADTSSSGSTSPHEPVACASLHANHGCHVVMLTQPGDSTQRSIPADSIRPLEIPLHLAAIAADIFHPPRA